MIASLRPGDDRQLYRIRIRHTAEDPRIRLRARSEVTADDRAEIDDQLERWDVASRDGPWTRQTLDLIATHPGERSAELARRIDTDQQRLKRRVRQVHNLGLTESLATGYRLSSRGHSYRSPDFPPDATIR